jgi:hypothetical protein
LDLSKKRPKISITNALKSEGIISVKIKGTKADNMG